MSISFIGISITHSEYVTGTRVHFCRRVLEIHAKRGTSVWMFKRVGGNWIT